MKNNNQSDDNRGETPIAGEDKIVCTDSRNNQIVILRSKDGDTYEIPASAACLSQLVKTTIECNSDDDEEDDEETFLEPIDLPKVGSNCLERVVSFCIHYENEPMLPIDASTKNEDTLEKIVTQTWYQDFIIDMDQTMVFELLTAANYMEIQPLLDLTCITVSIGFLGKSAEEIREILKIPKMTAEEEAQARKDHRWIFED